ncbi:hypothetical protein SLEP1_g41961 [Rubroshorea leprosula]|uniref:Uncharacterized protein n=1 Tax=Rubroshorea leprosula TaxID=152421 RepID=A0AAV5L870_9ROSI|nr:hypothetical protein SLEP1_g41961 [Rubroshorea leprosula]
MQVSQKEGESLRDYMQRFNKATLDIDNVPDTICLSALLHGLKRGRFLDDLLENPPKTWNEVNDRSASFILSEDFQSSKRRADDKPNRGQEQQPRREEKKKQKVGEQWGKLAEFPKYASYIPLTLPRSQILAQIQHWVRRPPPPLHDSPRADKSKHCDYHRVYGHNTEDCQHLKDELEFLARNGKLEGYVQKPHTQQPTQTHFVQAYDRPQGQRYQHGGTQDAYLDNQYPSEQSRAYRGRPFNRRGQGPRTTAPNQKDRKGVGYAGIPPPSGTINMISGGVHSGGQSARARKAYARQVMTVNKNRPLKRPFEEAEWENMPITFSLADYKRAEGESDIMMPHADPFVTTVHISNHNVNKVFIDTGSSPDILYWGCFQKMQLNPSSLQKHEGPIYGFDNQPVPVEGVITLPIYVGSESRFRMASVTFLVVKMESAFNAILGRATLCELKAVISQPHLCMKFPTPQGVGVLKGNQKMARACYQDTFKKVELAAAPGGPESSRPTQPGRQTMSISDIEHRPESVEQKAEPGAEQNYPLAEKAVFALVYTARKLRAYFQSHQIVVYTDFPLRKILQKPELSGRLIGWSVELSEYDLKFQPRTTIKGQAMADFLVECAPVAVKEKALEHPLWVLYVDGASNVEGSGAGAVLLGPDRFKSEHALRFKFQTTNNAAEYEALIYGLKLAAELKVQSIQVFSDSQLVVRQVNGSCDIRDPQLGRYASVVNRLKSRFASFQIDKIPRADNQRADELSKLASSQDINPQRSTIVEVLDAPSYTDFIVECQLLSTDPSTPSWTTPLMNYLQSGELPEDQSAAKVIKRRAAHFTVLDNQLYKRAASMPLLRCLTPYEAEYAVREIHEGVCGTHIDGRTLARKLLRHGYYWPTMVEDAQDYVKKCPTCQFNADDIHMLGIRARSTVYSNPVTAYELSISTFFKTGEMLSSLTSPRPFAQWGVDLLGPFVKGKGGCTFLVVAVDYFTKWIEAKPLSTTTERKIEEFLFNSILCRFGIPKRIIADNGPQFRAAALRSFCNDYGIELTLTSVYTPQSNGQAESANKIVLRGLKTRVLAAHSNWVDELNKVLWSCRTTPSSATGETPFSLAYGAEAVIPVEVGLPSDRAGRHDDLNNERLLRENLDFIEEVREMSRIRNVAHQNRVAKFYNKRVRARQFQVGDLVLRKAGLTNTQSHMGKLAPNWEGPYMVVRVKRPGSYMLADIHGHQLPYLWNVQNLKKFYS